MQHDLGDMRGRQAIPAISEPEPLTAWLRTALHVRYRSVLTEPLSCDLEALVSEMCHKS